MVPALEIFFDLRPVDLEISWTTWLLFYAGFYLLQILLAFYTLGSFRWEVLMLAAVSFPIYISALFNAITKKEQKWHVTGSKTKAQSPFNFMIPQVLVFVFLLLGSIVSIWRDLGNSQLSLATAWNVTNTFILGAFMVVALKESWRNKHPRPESAASDELANHLDDEPRPQTMVIVPPALESTLGIRPADDHATSPSELSESAEPRACRRSPRRHARRERGSSEMTWINRLRLFAGLLGVLLVVAVLTLIFNQRQTQAASLTATVATDSYTVGAAYGGTVTKQFIKDGDVVKKGQRLFTIQSVSFQQDIANGLQMASSDAYDVDPKTGTLTYKATVAGQVDDLKAKLGNSLGTGEPFATISVVGSQFVEAKYVLSPRDYERVQQGAPVSLLLPNNSLVNGTVSTIEVATEEGQALTEVRIDSKELKDSKLATLTKQGTPVIATLQLRDDGPLAGVTDSAFNFLRQIGLR